MPEPGPAHAWAAPPGAVVLGVVAAAGLAAWAVATTDPPGRLLVGLAALALGVVAGIGALARPRLRADDDGLALRGALGRRHWPWDRVDAVRVVRLRRLGLPAAYVEVEARDAGAAGAEHLLVLGRLELGADPADVAEALQAHRAAAGRRRTGSGSGEQQRPSHDEQDQHGGDGPDEGGAPRGA